MILNCLCACTVPTNWPHPNIEVRKFISQEHYFSGSRHEEMLVHVCLMYMYEAVSTFVFLM